MHVLVLSFWWCTCFDHIALMHWADANLICSQEAPGRVRLMPSAQSKAAYACPGICVHGAVQSSRLH